MSTVDLDLLADYVGGALDGTPEHDRIARLVADDPAWSSAAGELRSALLLVETDLAALAAVDEPMPDDVAVRFDTLFASPEFTAVPATAPRPAVGERTLTRDGRGNQSARRGWRRWATPVAVAAGVIALAGIVLPLGPLGPLQDGAGEGAANLADAPAVAPADGGVAVTTSGNNYDRAELSSKRTMASKAGPSSPEGTGQNQTMLDPGDLSRLSYSSEALTSCLDAIRTALPGTITEADFARFEGSPALIVTVDTQGGGWWFVAGPQCGVNGADELFRSPRD
ncbi:hypothetical protein [Catellatospora vulcania]|uniref:hypothetical protein n=1 Tax=Catellatospora vulcania TaxID=1460450 RepID=UPI0012D47986|nr:hypothetical protein [Catellatospora vulcania]